MTRVAENLRRLALEARLFTADAAEPSTWWDNQPFHRILLDVPCSATGVIRRHPDIKLLRRPGDIHELAQRQAELLRQAWGMLVPGGRLLYASCSVLHAETTRVIRAFLASTSNSRDITSDAVRALGFESGSGPGFRIRVGAAGMDGFYYAVLEKRSG